MDQQFKWLDQTIQKFEADPKIDHVFVATHSAMFPSGDHTDAGMWFFGSNDPRPMINGTRTDKGIIERRDQIIDVSINKCKKVIGFLTGSEHNFSTLEVNPTLPIYPDNYRAQNSRSNVPSSSSTTVAGCLLVRHDERHPIPHALDRQISALFRSQFHGDHPCDRRRRYP
jgi:hypothetical protein